MSLVKLLESGTYDTDKLTTHSYLEFYDELLDPIQHLATNVLEIGVQRGGSIIMWRDYFTCAHIYGIDIDKAPDGLVSENVTIFQCDAYDVHVIQDLFASNVLFDFIVDDGPHTLESMKFFAMYYSGLLAPDGRMVIEDIPYIEWTDKIIDCLPVRFKSRVEDRRSIKDRYDDILIVVENK